MVGGRPDNSGPRGVTIRGSLFRSVVLLIVFISAAILWITNHFSDKELQELSRTVIRHTLKRMDSEMGAFFEPVTRNLLVTRQWLGDGSLDRTDATEANLRFMPVLEHDRQISGVSIADASGNNYFLSRVPTEGGWEWHNRIISMGKEETRVSRRRFTEDGVELGEWEEEPDYDPRDRDWYTGAFQQADVAQGDATPRDPGADVYWVAPYEFFSTKRFGVTASVLVPSGPSGEDEPGHRSSCVLAMDVLVEEISRFTMRLAPTPCGKVFALTDDRKVIGLPSHRVLGNEEARNASVLCTVDELGIASVADALRDQPTGGLEARSPFAFQSGGEKWWGAIKPFQLSPEWTLWLGVVIPQADLLGAAQRDWVWFAVVMVLAMCVGMVLADSLAKGYSGPLTELLDRSERMSKLDLGARGKITSSLREVNALADSQESMRAALNSFSRYIPIEIVRELLRRGEAAKIGGSAKKLTILFTDIRGFTGVAETMQPSALTEHMAEYFEAMLYIIHAERGEVDKLIGDAIMAFWGAPKPNEHQATQSVLAVLRCLRRLGELNKIWEARGLPPLPTRFGLATGLAVVGNVGAPSWRINYTALGDTVNLASRLEGLNRVYGTDALVSASTMEAATGEVFLWRRVDRVTVKGKKEPVDIYEPLGQQGEVSPDRIEFAEHYESALARYQDQRFDKAMEVLRDLEQSHPNDLSVQRLLERCRDGDAARSGGDLDTVSRFRTK